VKYAGSRQPNHSETLTMDPICEVHVLAVKRVILIHSAEPLKQAPRQHKARTN
jgi:hypothetical protein